MSVASFLQDALAQVLAAFASIAAALSLGWIKQVNNKAETALDMSEGNRATLQGREEDKLDKGVVHHILRIEEAVEEQSEKLDRVEAMMEEEKNR